MMSSPAFLLAFFLALSNGIDSASSQSSALLESASWNEPKSANQGQRDQSQPRRQLSEFLLALSAIKSRNFPYPRRRMMSSRISNTHLVVDDSLNLNALTVPALQDKLRSVGLKVSGRKAELVARLNQHMEDGSHRSKETLQIMEGQGRGRGRGRGSGREVVRQGGGGRDRGIVGRSSDSQTGVVPERRDGGIESKETVEANAINAPGKPSSEGARFDQLPISSATKRAISEGFGYEFMTDVQAQTVGPILEGNDVLARAKTGTGKTLAFLIPSIELVCKQPSQDNIQVLIISPARELASQIFKDAKGLLSTHRELRAMCMFGGRDIKKDLNELKAGSCNVLVATPGRLLDHLANTPGFARRVSKLEFLILDEADQLLEMGFRNEILKIVKFIPKAGSRQSLLFSATFPQQIEDIANLVLAPGYRTINTVKPEDESTPDQIEQSYCVAPTEEMTEHLWDALQVAMHEAPKDFKVVVFFTTARLVGYYAELFGGTGLGSDLFEIHSRLSQGRRTKESDRFRKASRGILFSSDVSARGLDYPGVTKVIQVGAPSSSDQYIHRLGRTGRAGSSGSGLLLLQDFETYFVRALKDLPVQKIVLTGATSRQPAPEALSRAVSEKTIAQAYAAWLGYYNGKLRDLKMDKKGLVKQADRFAASMNALDRQGRPPPITRKTVGKMGLKGVPGLNLVGEYSWK